MGTSPRTQLVLVSGMSRDDVRRTGELLLGPGTVLVEHDLRGLVEGVVERRLTGPADPADADLLGTDLLGTDGLWTALELAHGCVNCTLREDLLPLLLRLGRDVTTRRVVVLLDPAMEPEPVSEALHGIVPLGDDATVLDVVDLQAVVAVLDATTWLADAGSDDALADRGLALSEDDDRTIAQLVVGQAEFADLLLLAGVVPEGRELVRLGAVLARLAPRSAHAVLGRGAEVSDADIDLDALLTHLPPSARRGVPDDPHGALLRGQPPLHHDAGVSLLHVEERRPFHPGRLHEAFDVLLEGTIRVRGRLWVATQPDVALWVESAGGGLQIGHAGPWLAAGDARAWTDAGPDRRAGAALRWHERFGDREQQLVVLAHEADPAVLLTALLGALLTDDELDRGEEAWRQWDDPFGSWHADPCDPEHPDTEQHSTAAPTVLTDEDLRRGGPA